MRLASVNKLTVSFCILAVSFSHALGYPITSELRSCHGKYAGPPRGVTLTGTPKKWHPYTFTFDGPMSSEASVNNPFLNFKLTVTFTYGPSTQMLHVPGYYAADGNAANTGAKTGNKWRVHFTPPRAGYWKATVHFRTGLNIAVIGNPWDGSPVPLNGRCLSFNVHDFLPARKGSRDHRFKGMLRYVGQRYLQFENGEYFLKGGVDSPENLLGYKDFDGTYSQAGGKLKHFASHIKDWRPGNPTWQGGKGKGLIGALNYLASTGANAFSFLTFNVNGDGKDVWPFIEPFAFNRYDVSKLDQWNIVFTHADTLGMFMHFKTQEIENDILLDKGRLGVSRKLYYRELIARFAHHHALNWNLGEENDIWKEIGDSSQENVKQYIKYFHNLDPYNHPVVIHSYPGQHENVYKPLLGKSANLDGMSLQTHWWNVHNMTLEWSERSSRAGRIWVVCNDEQNGPQHGVRPDGLGSNRDEIRRHVLWGNLMAGGAGVEYYFGYQHHNNDLNANDWRSRATKWKDINTALNFFQTNTPFYYMHAAQYLAHSNDVYAFAKHRDIILYYFHGGGVSTIEVPEGTYRVYWFNPRTGNMFNRAPQNVITGTRVIRLSHPDYHDWALVLKAIQESP